MAKAAESGFNEKNICSFQVDYNSEIFDLTSFKVYYFG